MCADLDPGLAEVHSPGELLPHEGVRVVGSLEYSLQCCQLLAVKSGPVPSRLFLLRLVIFVVAVVI